MKIIITENQLKKILDYRTWKRKNVTLRGIKNIGEYNNVYGSFGKGLYTTPLSNKSMARQYGKVYFVLNGKPKNPKIVETLNDAEMFKQKIVYNFCKKHNKNYSLSFFEDNTTFENEMLKIGYDGLIIKGREMVNYTPEDVQYFDDEQRLLSYFNTTIKSKLINENKCEHFHLTNEIIKYINKFESDEQLLRSGGIPTDMLDRLSFGFSENDITIISPKKLKIKWKDDLENVLYKIKYLKLKPIEWAKQVDLSEPIDVSFEKNNFYVEDGHHRYFASKLLNKDLKINLTINMNPITNLTKKLNYDQFHRCIFKQVKEKHK